MTKTKNKLVDTEIQNDQNKIQSKNKERQSYQKETRNICKEMKIDQKGKESSENVTQCSKQTLTMCKTVAGRENNLKHKINSTHKNSD